MHVGTCRERQRGVSSAHAGIVQVRGSFLCCAHNSGSRPACGIYPLRKTCGGVQRDNTWVYCEHGSRDACRPPVCPPPPRGGFASSQLGGSGNRTSAFRTSPQVFTTGVVPHYHQPRHAIPSLPLPSADACCEGSLGAGLPSPRERGFPWARLTAAIVIVVEVFSHHAAPACRFTRAHAWRWALRRTFSGMLQASPRYATAHAAG